MKEGRFPAIVTKHFFDKVGKKETEVIRFTLEVDVDGETESAPYLLWLTDATFEKGMVGRTLSAMGFNYKESGLEILDEDPVHLCGREVMVDCREEENRMTGEPEVKIAFVNRRPVKPTKERYGELTEQLRKYGQGRNVTEDPGSGDDGGEIPF